MEEVLLAGYKNTPADKLEKDYWIGEGYKVRTYNHKPGFADYTDIYKAAKGVEKIVDMSNDKTDNNRFKSLVYKIADIESASVVGRRK